jgi:O-antigen/teichoic acid export membrane protein
MLEHQASYRRIMKSTSIFGAVQVVNIIIQIIRSKVIAILLGPAGIGLIGLLNSSIGLIGNLTNFGLRTSAVKEVSSANGLQNNNKIVFVISVIRRLVWMTGILGTLTVIIISPWLSELTFGSKNYTIGFICLSITILIQQLSNSHFVILQGMQRLKLLAKANLMGNILGLLVTLPLYYIYELDGIVPSILGSSIITLILSFYYAEKVKVGNVHISFNQALIEGKEMLRMGFFVSLSGLLSVGASYIVRAFINRIGSIEEVGLYTAGFVIINTYVGFIFTAMGTDYYPRLSKVAHSNILSKQTINQQADVALLILAPILIFFLIFINRIIIVLYSNEFVSISAMIYWAALGMLFKSTSWSIGYVLLARGTTKLFFYNELLTNFYGLFLNLLGYYYFGLTGLGLSFLISYVLNLIQLYVVANFRFEFSFDPAYVRTFIVQFSLTLFSFLTVKFISKPYFFYLGIFFIMISVSYSLMELNKRLGIPVSNRFKIKW